MILVPVRVGPSQIEGTGLFALETLPAGTPFYRFEPGFDRAFTPADVSRLPEPAQRHLRHYAWQRHLDHAWVLSGDLACFMNHSGSPNTGIPPGADDSDTTVTLRTVTAGEELTCDYFAFDLAARDKLGPSAAAARD